MDAKKTGTARSRTKRKRERDLHQQRGVCVEAEGDLVEEAATVERVIGEQRIDY
jgi:hypothetical protein